ncbi:hypothetical protein [Neobacillus sp.]|uniref:hypothetical protein n=1 Tax=Neobacillus sp. TaxID=2675273 RepID=UPI002899E3FF|nr:hypothetical protein [Neobacillus sp.]
MNIPVAVITDLDVRPIEYYNDQANEVTTKVYCINDSNIEELQNQFPDISFDAIKDEVFKSKSSFEEALQTIKLTKRAPIGFKNYCVEKSQCEINMEFIESIRLKNREAKQRRFVQDKVEAFISSKWTLEYDIALSDLRDYIFKSIWASRIEKNSGEIEFNEEVFSEQLESELHERKKYWEENEHTPKEIAYEIYMSLLKGGLSKAINAQYLANLLYRNKERVREILERDEYLKYLVDAIHYVTNTTGTLGGE